MAFTINWDQVSSLVQDYYMPRVKDNFFLSNAFYYRTQSRIKTYQGGRSIVVPVSTTSEGGGGGWYATTDKFDTRIRNPITAAQFFAKNANVPISIDSDEELAVGGPTALMQLVDAKMKIAQRTAIDLIGTDLFNTGQNPKAITGLQYALQVGPSASGTTVPTHTYGGFASGSNSWWNHSVNGLTDNTVNTGALLIAEMGRMWAQIGIASGKSPTLLLSNWGTYTMFHSTLLTNERYVRPQQNSDLAKVGFENVMYKTAPLVVDERSPRTATAFSMTAGAPTVYTAANKPETLYFLNEETMKLIVHTQRNLSFEPWRKPFDQDARIAYIFWRGEVCFDERRANGVIGNIATANFS